jgi:hypothetical protein
MVTYAVSAGECLSAFDGVTSYNTYFFCNTAIRTLNFVLLITLSQSYELNAVRPVGISVSVWCCLHDIIIFCVVQKQYMFICVFFVRCFFIIQRAFARQRCESDTKPISGNVIYS